jgi:hypothetical protein
MLPIPLGFNEEFITQSQLLLSVYTSVLRTQQGGTGGDLYCVQCYVLLYYMFGFVAEK